MPFSARARFDAAPNPLSRLLEEKRKSGARVVDLTLSNPTRAGFEYPKDLLEPLRDEGGLLYEPAPLGLPQARSAVAEDFRRRGQELAPEQVVLTASSSEAYAFLFKLLLDPGDTVLVPRPSYPLFEYLARLEGGRTEFYDLDYDDEWHLSVEKLAGCVTSRTRAVCVVHPNNPTGSFLKQAEAHALSELCAARGLALVSDEVFADYAFGEDPRRARSVAANGDVLAFSLAGLSKSCGLPQLKLGWIGVSGPSPARAEALRLLELIADSYLSVGTPVQLAAARLLQRMPELQGPIRSRLLSNLAALERRTAGSPATLLRVEGGWYAVLRVPRTLPEEERVLRLLRRHDVLVHPGFFFDFPDEAHLVLSLLPREEEFGRGVEAVLADVQEAS
jgi:aspartate/methionine/tyrosine aminotransferase